MNSPTSYYLHCGSRSLCFTVSFVLLGLVQGTNAFGQSYTLKTLVNFDAATGQSPMGSVTLDSNNNLYGTTYFDGSVGAGTVFEIAAGTNTLTTIAAFNGINGGGPTAGVTFDSSGNIYGTASAGGIDSMGDGGDGTVFEIRNTGTSTNPSFGSTINTLAIFGVPANSAAGQPFAAVTLDSKGDIYGTTYPGGNLNGQVYELANTGTIGNTSYGNFLTPVVKFNNGTTFESLTLGPNGNLYGSTYGYGTAGGTIFEITVGTNAVTTIATFDPTVTQGLSSPLLFDSKGDIYGTTTGTSGTSNGAIFEIPNLGTASNPAFGTTPTTLATFNVANGKYPSGHIIMDSSGNIYGTTTEGGASGDGTVFELRAGTDSVQTLVTFGGLNGERPEGGLTVDSQGNLYGTTYGGGSSGDGTVFELSLNSAAASAPEPAAYSLLLLALPLGLSRRFRK